mmetsp:Transcript_30564/g.97566  ORF Transcript_30564/g.97566 Transcript_30564/m.97566 type:complete len:227 (+) Transcript_30564:1055-1735(+)
MYWSLRLCGHCCTMIGRSRDPAVGTRRRILSTAECTPRITSSDRPGPPAMAAACASEVGTKFPTRKCRTMLTRAPLKETRLAANSRSAGDVWAWHVHRFTENRAARRDSWSRSWTSDTHWHSACRSLTKVADALSLVALCFARELTCSTRLLYVDVDVLLDLDASAFCVYALSSSTLVRLSNFCEAMAKQPPTPRGMGCPRCEAYSRALAGRALSRPAGGAREWRR